MLLGTYDPKGVIFTFGGRQITGFAEGSFITAERDEDAYGLYTGADGISTRSRNNNRAGTIKLKLQRASPDNQILSSFAAADEVSNGSVEPLFIKDAASADKHTAPSAWIQKQPSWEAAKDMNEVEWVFRTDVLISNFGGI